MESQNSEKREVIYTSIKEASSYKDVNANFPKGKSIIHQTLATDPDTGMYVQREIYEAGVCPPVHRHKCGHGMYVLSGTLLTDKGEFGPGSFIWWPAGNWMLHGATDREDAEVLFITNKPFDLEFRDNSFLDADGK